MATTSPSCPPNLRRPLPKDFARDLASVNVKLLPLTASTKATLSLYCSTLLQHI